ncbi:MAG: hypothetical protein J6Q34_03435 [Bacteroidales bacterium]|nr:hypothetical protein [Bacteroidales bacterium]
MKKIYILTIILCGALSCKSNNSEQYATKRPNCKTTINNHDNSINEIYHITNKVIVFQVINEDEMLKLLKSYQLQEYDEELAQNRACGVVAITKSRENCLTFLRLLENNPNLVRDDICYDLMSTNEGDIVMSNIKHVEGFDNAKIKLLDKLTVLDSLQKIYSIIYKANTSQKISEDEMITLLKSYNEHKNNVELSQYRALGIASIIMNYNNCTTLLSVLETNSCLYKEKMCDDMMYPEENKDTVIRKINAVPGFDDIKSKILDKLNMFE